MELTPGSATAREAQGRRGARARPGRADRRARRDPRRSSTSRHEAGVPRLDQGLGADHARRRRQGPERRARQPRRASRPTAPTCSACWTTSAQARPAARHATPASGLRRAERAQRPAARADRELAPHVLGDGRGAGGAGRDVRDLPDVPRRVAPDARPARDVRAQHRAAGPRPEAGGRRPGADDPGRVGARARPRGAVRRPAQGDPDGRARPARRASASCAAPRPTLEALHAFLQELNPILSFANFNQQVLAGFVTNGSLAFNLDLDRPGEAEDGIFDYVLQQFGIINDTSLSLNQTRPAYDVGNAYIEPNNYKRAHPARHPRGGRLQGHAAASSRTRTSEQADAVLRRAAVAVGQQPVPARRGGQGARRTPAPQGTEGRKPADPNRAGGRAHDGPALAFRLSGRRCATLGVRAVRRTWEAFGPMRTSIMDNAGLRRSCCWRLPSTAGAGPLLREDGALGPLRRSGRRGHRRRRAACTWPTRAPGASTSSTPRRRQPAPRARSARASWSARSAWRSTTAGGSTWSTPARSLVVRYTSWVDGAAQVARDRNGGHRARAVRQPAVPRSGHRVADLRRGARQRASAVALDVRRRDRGLRRGRPSAVRPARGDRARALRRAVRDERQRFRGRPARIRPAWHVDRPGRRPGRRDQGS